MTTTAPLPSPFRGALSLTTLACIALALSPLAVGAQLHPVALSGEPAPGTAEGTTFLAFGSPYDPSLPPPQVDETGRILFFAFLNGPGVDFFTGHGLWIADGTSTTLLARAGDPAPGTAVRFLGLPNDIVPAGFDLAGAAAVVPATLHGTGVDFFNDSGVWTGGPGSLALLLREGAAAPGTGAVFFEPVLIRLTAAGGLFAATLRGAGITTDDDESIWTVSGGAATLRAREGDAAPGTGAVFARGDIGAGPATFPYADWNDSGQIVLRANLLGERRLDHTNDEALYVDRGSGLQLVLREGDPAPGAGKRMVFGGGITTGIFYPQINALGQIAFPVNVGGKIGRETVRVGSIYSDHHGSLAPVAMQGQNAPGTGAPWQALIQPHLSDAGRIAFMGAVNTDFHALYGVFWDQRGSLEKVLMPGDPAPGRPGKSLFGVRTILGFTAEGTLLFFGHIADDVTGIAVTALLAATADGSVQTVVAGGDAVEVRPGDARVVATVHPGEIGEDGTIALRLTFKDGTSGVFTARLSP